MVDWPAVDDDDLGMRHMETRAAVAAAALEELHMVGTCIISVNRTHVPGL